MIALENVSKQFPGSARPAVDAVSFEVREHSLFVLLGESGSGKTTTLRLINRLIDADSGRITVNDRDVSMQDAASLRRGIGYAIQGGGLFPHLSVARNIAIVPQLLRWTAQEIDERVDELLNAVKLPPQEFRDRLPRELSGGQQQRVGVARALAARAPILLMDEPFGALDPLTRDELQSEMKTLQAELGLTVVLVTHDINEALLLGDRIGVMHEGALIACDTPSALLAHPPNLYVNELMRTPRRQAAVVAELLGGADD